MCQYSSVDGFANDWHLVHLGSRAVGGAGLIIAEASAVTEEGRISPDDLGIWKDGHTEMLSRIFGFIEAQGSVAGIQLAHAGRKASTSAPWKGHAPLSPAEGGWSPIFAPSGLAFDEGHQVPVELDRPGIERVIAGFKEAARRSLEAGAKVVEIHAAHGYLLHSFLSPLSNKRTDEYGGSFENRVRLLCKVTEEIRKVWPERYPLFTRISATDWVEGGWTVEDSVALARKLGTLGVDLIDCSTGGNLPDAKIPVGPGYQVPFAARVRAEAGMMTGAVGMITEPAQANEIIRKNDADVILMAREFLRDPYWPLHAAKEFRLKVAAPAQYGRAFQ
jgi:2,4-dienoyl-CoA reductase-like NADH-dependent reductase (Old Yellow Enzyme family)